MTSSWAFEDYGRRMARYGLRPAVLALGAAVALGLAGRVAVHGSDGALAAAGHAALALGAPWLVVAWLVGGGGGSRAGGAPGGGFAPGLGRGRRRLTRGGRAGRRVRPGARHGRVVPADRGGGRSRCRLLRLPGRAGVGARGRRRRRGVRRGGRGVALGARVGARAARGRAGRRGVAARRRVERP